MDLHRNFFCIFLLILSRNTKICLQGAPVEGSVINTELTGQELIRMGNVMNKPLLSLLGATFMKTEQNVNKNLFKKMDVTEKKLQDGINKLTLDTSKERELLKTELCKQVNCAAWTEWSSCSANYLKSFGTRTRSRICGGTSSFCSTGSVEKIETDYQICQGKICKHTLTKNSFCINMYQSIKKKQRDAKEDCHKDNGHLMNIDSALKSQDVLDYFKNITLKYDVWIDGTRTLPDGDMRYEYGSNDTTLSMWTSGEPESTDDCKIFDYANGKWKWRGRKCSDTYYYLCEIV